MIYKMKHTTLTLVLLIFSILGYTQDSIIEGYTLGVESTDTIPYATVGIVKKGIGTVSNNDGQFSLDLTQALDTDSIQISSIGYKTVTMTVETIKKTLKSNPVIRLEENIEILDEVVISTKRKWKQKTIGSDVTSSKWTQGFSSNLGSQLGRKMNIGRKPTRLLKFNTHVAINSYETIKLRLNIYNADGKYPGDKINTENIYVDFSGESGPMTIDLEKYNIIVTDDIYVTLEWVDNLGDGQFRISAKIGSSGIKHKWASADEWRTIPFTLGYNMLVEF